MENNENNFYWPSKEDSFFKLGSVFCANVGFLKDDFIIYANGYKNAADALCNAVFKERSEKDTFVYPIVFLYRHSIELIMKAIIIETGRYESIELQFQHEISKIWLTVKEIIMQSIYEYDKNELSYVDKLLSQLTELDNSSMNFRYPVNKKFEVIIPEIHIDIYNFGFTMQGLFNYLTASFDIIRENNDNYF